MVGRGYDNRDLILLYPGMAKGRRNKGVTLNPAKFFKGIALLLFLFVTISFGSCVTQKACLEKFPIKETHDTIIIYKPGIIPVPIPGTPIISIQTSVNLIPSVIITRDNAVSSIITDTLYVESGTAHARAWVANGKLNLEVHQSDSVYTVKIDSLNRELQIKDTEIYTIQAKCDKGKGERFLDKLIMLVVILFGGVLIIYIIKLFK